MTFSTTFARALMPVAILAAAAPAAAAGVGRPCQAEVPYFGRADDDRQFRPDRCQGPLGGRNASAQAAGQGAVSIWKRRPAAGGRRQAAVLPRLSGRPEEQLAARPARLWARCFPVRRTSTARPRFCRTTTREFSSLERKNTAYGQLTLAFLRSASAPGGPSAVWLDRDRRAEQAHHGQAVERALQRRRTGQRLHLRRAAEAKALD